eukprot:scaffold17519_cov124-Isochrysis_galbana.AAC.3
MRRATGGVGWHTRGAVVQKCQGVLARTYGRREPLLDQLGDGGCARRRGSSSDVARGAQNAAATHSVADPRPWPLSQNGRRRRCHHPWPALMVAHSDEAAESIKGRKQARGAMLVSRVCACALHSIVNTDS